MHVCNSAAVQQQNKCKQKSRDGGIGAHALLVQNRALSNSTPPDTLFSLFVFVFFFYSGTLNLGFSVEAAISFSLNTFSIPAEISEILSFGGGFFRLGKKKVLIT